MPTTNLTTNAATDTITAVLKSIWAQLPPGAEWVPVVALALLAGFGLVLLFRGARILPAIASLLFGLTGAGAGLQLARAFGASDYVMVPLGAAVGAVLGLVLFRLWLGLMVGGCLVAVALGVYTGHFLAPALSQFPIQHFDVQHQLVQLPPAGAVVASAQKSFTELPAELWSYLSDNDKSFQARFYTLVIGAALVGLFFGLLLPRIARSFWAATAATALLCGAAFGLLQIFAPGKTPWLNQWWPGIIGVTWGVALLVNLLDMFGGKRKAAPATTEKKTAAAKQA